MTGLELAGVSAGYDGGTVLHRLDLAVHPGTVHAMVGHNGAGKTTLVHAVAGLCPVAAGRVLVAGRDLTRWPAHRRCRAGIGLVPQGRRVFASLTVAEHLAIAYRRSRWTLAGVRGVLPAGAGAERLAVAHRPSRWTPAGVLELLPALAARRTHRAGHLSGGEQQMLAIARALLTQPAVLLLDEPTEGLAPAVAGQIERLIGELAREGLTILLTAPTPDLARAVASDLTVLTTGRITHRFTAAEVRSHPDLLIDALTPTGGER